MLRMKVISNGNYPYVLYSSGDMEDGRGREMEMEQEKRLVLPSTAPLPDAVLNSTFLGKNA